MGFKDTESDHGVFIKRWEDREFVVVDMHVNDCLSIGSSQGLVTEFKKKINEKYKMTDLGPCKWLLGIKIDHDLANGTLALLQHTYIDSIVAQFNFDDLKPLVIPMDPAALLLKSQSSSMLVDITKMNHVPYQKAVDSLMYAAMGTRPDIAFATSTVAQFLKRAHWEAVKRIFQYLKETRNVSLVYGEKQKNLQG